ncbi:MAG: recombinase family protein [Salinivirgaceae bacterium]|nr:recombinase family protein [Salinivirgaceae bacterium]
MKTLGYLRVSTDNQDIEKQKHLLLEYAQQNKFIIDKFITSEMSSTKSQSDRKINILLEELDHGDKLLVAELSRLGRNMLEVLNLVEKLNEKNITIIFIRQPEISTNAPHTKLLFAIYSYFAQAEREFIAMRTKQGLAAARANGVILGRPKGSKNKKGQILDPFREQIKEYMKMDLPVASIMKIINTQIDPPLPYNTFRIYIISLKDDLNPKNVFDN